ncbi:cytochrome P450 [Pseudonocardia hierapolitana]|uniref:Cytochrome P450 n=1 Tax=Pseudonocardia hierapolitana TaxID=1128676 RepID=A0A561SP14_9PSEU|nr:cytochrome P450 [Pseudonocardia hierapolitana]TWF76615.1 cytochrome P450 [Pseudonocardia hierapolitana]
MTITARRHEAGLLWASRPSLALLLHAARFAPPIARIPRLGWIIRDPMLCREILNEHRHFTLLGEGGVGHLWAQVLGDYVTELFDGPGHLRLRTKARDLFTTKTSADLVAEAFDAPLDALTARLRVGGTVDVADTSRVLVGRMLATLLGLPRDRPDDEFRAIFAEGERLAAVALHTAASTVLAPHAVAEARGIVERMTAGVPAGYRDAPPGTLLGRCRELGLGVEVTRGLAGLLLVAGTETAATAMTRAVALLHDHRLVDALLADPDRIDDVVREVLRVVTPAPVIGRHVSADVEIGRHLLKAGEQVMLLTYAANNAAGGFDPNRAYVPETRQLWFGGGRHLCLGAALAKAEMAALLRALLRAGRPWRVVHRRPARRVLIPRYESLQITLTGRP